MTAIFWAISAPLEPRHPDMGPSPISLHFFIISFMILQSHACALGPYLFLADLPTVVLESLRPKAWEHRPTTWDHRPTAWDHRPKAWDHRPTTWDEETLSRNFVLGSMRPCLFYNGLCKRKKDNIEMCPFLFHVPVGRCLSGQVSFCRNLFACLLNFPFVCVYL